MMSIQFAKRIAKKLFKHYITLHTLHKSADYHPKDVEYVQLCTECIDISTPQNIFQSTHFFAPKVRFFVSYHTIRAYVIAVTHNNNVMVKS